jgi:hypothetical protein
MAVIVAIIVVMGYSSRKVIYIDTANNGIKQPAPS